MNMKPQTPHSERLWRAHARRLLVAASPPVALAVALGLSWAGLRSAHAAVANEPAVAAEAPAADASATAEPATPGEVAATPARRRLDTRGATLDGRIRLLAKELDLSPAQQGQVKKVLLSQREQVVALWNDTSVPAALRVSRTQTIGDRTADQIRALLNDAQREKYIKPRVRDATVGSAGANLEAWMAPLRAK